MQEFTPPADLAIINAYGTQAACAFVLSALLIHFYGRYRKGYLLDWCTAWFCLVIFHTATAIDLFALPDLTSRHILTTLSLLIAMPAALLQSFYFYSGSYQLANLRPLRGASARRAIVVAAALGVIGAAVVAISGSYRVHYFALVGVQSLIFSIALIGSALQVQRRRSTAAFGLLLAVIIGYAVMKLVCFMLAALWLTRDLVPYTTMIGLVELLLQFGVGLAMIISLLEDEREAAALAASEIEHLAYHDGLTGLPNRALFFDRLIMALSHAQRHGSRVAVLFIDLDHFKTINDSLGHSSGDTILRTAAMRIRETVRREDTVSRFGGDEFTVILYNVEPIEDVSRVAQKVIEALKAPVNIGSREIVVSASIGISTYPGDARDAEALVKNADTAMYRAKERGRDCYQLFAPEMNARAVEKLEIENNLRKALRDGQLTIFYQPLYDLERGRIFGMEALLRWRHPELGILSPAKFIPAAEASGLIIPIGAWVLKEACRTAKQWQSDYGHELVVSVNVSARQFQHTHLVDDVNAALSAANLAPHLLEIEITESIAVQNVEHTKALLTELKEIGVRISIDDFGTGYSSLSYLKDFPVDTLKLDRSFVQDITRPQDGAIASSVIAMAHSLRMKVMAEGVENEGQIDFLKQHRCDRLQGFFYSVPLAPDAFENFMSENPWLFQKH